MSRKSWRASRLRRRQRRRTATITFEDKTATVSAKGRKSMLAKAAVAMHLSADEAERFLSPHAGFPMLSVCRANGYSPARSAMLLAGIFLFEILNSSWYRSHSRRFYT